MLYIRYIAAFLVTFVLIAGSLNAQGTGGSQGSGVDVYQSYKQKKNYVFHPRPLIMPNKSNGQNGYNGQNGAKGQIYQSWKSRG